MTKRRGFTLIFVIVLTAIIALLFATVATTLTNTIASTNAQAAVTILTEINTGLTAFKTANNTYPNRIAELSDSIFKGNATYNNSCGAGNTFSNPQVTSWLNTGPYIPFLATAGTRQGVYTPVGFINDTMIRNPNSASAGFLEVQINGVSLADAQMMDILVDGAANASAGTIRYGATTGTGGAVANDTVTVTYWFAVVATC